MLPGVIVSQLY